MPASAVGRTLQREFLKVASTLSKTPLTGYPSLLHIFHYFVSFTLGLNQANFTSSLPIPRYIIHINTLSCYKIHSIYIPLSFIKALCQQSFASSLLSLIIFPPKYLQISVTSKIPNNLKQNATKREKQLLPNHFKVCEKYESNSSRAFLSWFSISSVISFLSFIFFRISGYFDSRNL